MTIYEPRKEIEQKLNEAYGMWLLEEFPDEIHNSDQHIEAMESHSHIEEFLEYVKFNI